MFNIVLLHVQNQCITQPFAHCPAQGSSTNSSMASTTKPELPKKKARFVTAQPHTPYNIRANRESSNRRSYKDIVEILVGEDQKYCVHREVITKRSLFFEAALSKRWREGQTSEPLKLPEDDADIFDLYLHCIYTNTVDIGDLDRAFNGERYLNYNDPGYMRLARLYSLADRVQDTDTADLVMNALLQYDDEHKDCLPGEEVINFAMHCTTNTSPLRRFIIDLYGYTADAAAFEILGEATEIPGLFLANVLTRKAQLEEDGLAPLRTPDFVGEVVAENSCLYHQHDGTKPACNKLWKGRGLK